MRRRDEMIIEHMVMWSALRAFMSYYLKRGDRCILTPSYVLEVMDDLEEEFIKESKK